MFKRLWPTASALSASTRAFQYDDSALADAGELPRSRAPVAATAAAAAGVRSSSSRSRTEQEQEQSSHRDDAPMTPVVYVVLWTSVAVGCLRGYAINSAVSARVAPSYTFFFSGVHQAEMLRRDSPYCTNGVDSLPGVLWYEGLIGILPPVVAPILGAVFVRYYGRKAGIMLGCVMLMVGQILLASAVALVTLYIGQAFVIGASDILFLSIALQDIEIASRHSRGFFLLVHIVGYSLGSCAVAVVGFFVSNQTSLGWRLMFAMGTLPAMTVLLVTPWLYETPHSLIERGCYAQGWEALREIRGPFYDDTYGEFMSIVRAAAAAPKGFMMYVELLRKRCYWPAIIVGVSMAAVAALLDPLSRSYVVYQTLTRSGVSFNSAVLMCALSLNGAYALGALISVILVDRVGRLPLLRASSAMALIAVTALVATAMFYAAKMRISLYDSNLMPQIWARLQLATLAVMAGGNGIAWSSAAWVIICESQSLAVRPAAVALSIGVTNLAASVVESKLLCVLKLKYYYLVLVVSMVALIIAFGLVPETGRVSLEDISALYAQHWLWRRLLKPKRRKRSSNPTAPAGQLPKQTPKPPPSGGAGGGGVGAGAGGGGGGGGGAAGLPARYLSGDDVAAHADAVPVPDTNSTSPGISPFGSEEVQLDRGTPAGGADDQKTAEALAAASRIALAGATSMAAVSSLHSSQGLQHGWGSRRLRLGGRKKSSQVQDLGVHDAFDQLTDELQVDN